MNSTGVIRGDVNQKEHSARYKLGGRGGRYREMTQKKVESQLWLGCAGKPSSFFFSSPPPQDCLALAYGVSILLSDRCEEGVEEEEEGEESD